MNLAKKGFTLIELLVVIAIITILAAIILPVYSQARRSAYRSADMSNMNQLRSALQLYRVDQGAYPPSLLGYVTQYSNGGNNPTTADVLPANFLQGALFPNRVNSLNTFQPSLDRGLGGNINAQFSTAVWPSGEISPDGNSSCDTSSPDTANCRLQHYGPATEVEYCSAGELIPAYYYTLSGYDMAQVNAAGGGTRNEIHYSPFWSVFTVPSECAPSDAAGNANDNPAQLGYYDPPDSTVVTWNSWYRDYDSNGNPLHQKQDIVLFLAGDARPYDSATVAADAWQITP
jgi:prepilin-type N-terminal cleavage/methylation domain-containing protein